MKKQKNIFALLFAISIALDSYSTIAAALNTDMKSKTFSVKLGASRVIYPAGSAGAQTSIQNMQDFPILVQTQVLNEDRKTKAPFLVTPSLFRLEANQQSRIRVISLNKQLPEDQESLFWMCSLALPPKDDDAEIKDHVAIGLNMSINSCYKLIYRPSGLESNLEESAGRLQWSRKGSELQVQNPTPYYMNLSTVTVGGKLISKVNYVPPKKKILLKLPENAVGEVSWTVINDQGGESKIFHSTMS